MNESTRTGVVAPATEPLVESIASPTQRPLAARGLFSGMRRRTLLALLDQAVVSGGRFAVTLLVGRLAGKSELGVYALGFSWIVLFACIQEALITIPYTVFSARLRRNRGRFRSAVLRHHVALAAAAALLAATATGLLAVGSVAPHRLAVAAALIAAIPCSLMWEFGRRIAFADDRVGVALGLDVAALALQLAGVALLASWDRMTAATTLAICAAAWAAAGIAGAVISSALRTVSARTTAATARKNWRLARWMLAAQVVRTLDVYLPFWIVAYLVGEVAAGELAACLTLITLTNPIVLGVGNVLGPRLARAFAEEGVEGVRTVSRFASRSLACVLGPAATVVMFGGQSIVAALFGDDYQGLGQVAALLGLVIWTMPWQAPASSALWTLDRSDVDFRVTAVATGVHAALSLALTPPLGVRGAVLAIAAASAISSIAKQRALATLVAPSSGEGRP